MLVAMRKLNPVVPVEYLDQVTIVANTNPSYTVPGGGQNGIITMYPFPGGSGVVEVQPNWTLTPPWVNGYAPIN